MRRHASPIHITVGTALTRRQATIRLSDPRTPNTPVPGRSALSRYARPAVRGLSRRFLCFLDPCSGSAGAHDRLPRDPAHAGPVRESPRNGSDDRSDFVRMRARLKDRAHAVLVEIWSNPVDES